MIKEMLSFHTRIGYKNAIGEKAIALRKNYKIKVPDAIILAYSLVFNIPIITSDKALGKVAGIRCVVFEL
jgi:predicted nucleic acid-binding protein